MINKTVLAGKRNNPETTHRHIQNPVEHLKMKLFAKSFILDVRLGSEYG